MEDKLPILRVQGTHDAKMIMHWGNIHSSQHWGPSQRRSQDFYSKVIHFLFEEFPKIIGITKMMKRAYIVQSSRISVIEVSKCFILVDQAATV